MFDSSPAVGALVMLMVCIVACAHAQDTQSVPCVAGPPPKGQVIEIATSTVVVSGSGWTRDDDVEIVRFGSGMIDGEAIPESVAAGRVLSVAPGRAVVLVDMDTRIPVGASVERAARVHRDYPLAPDRLPGVVHVGFDARTFLPLDLPPGVGMLGSAFGMYRFESPVAVRFTIASAGFLTSPPGGTVFDGNVAVTFDTQYFELGLGAGAMTSYWFTDPLSFEVAHFLRVGAIDGLMTEAQFTEYLVNATFMPGDAFVLVQVPIARSWWLVTRGGGGRPLAFYGEQGARYLMSGNGDRGSLFITVMGGASGVPAIKAAFYGPSRLLVAGPSLSLGLEWRF